MAPVISTIMLVAITVVIAAVLFVMISSIMAPPPKPPVAVTMESRGWSAGTNTAVVSSATGTGGIELGNLEFILTDVGGQKYYGGAGDHPEIHDNVTFNVRYLDTDGNGQISPGDKLVVEVDPLAGVDLVDGGVVEIHEGGRQIASHSLS